MSDSASARGVKFRLSGLIAATFTPMNADGAIDLDRIPSVSDFVLGQGADGLFVCGSTGESASLTTSERMDVTEAYVAAAKKRAPVVIHVGHNSLRDAQEIAAHAERVGASAIAAAPPSYFRPGSVEVLTECLGEIASAAPNTPLYYYHIPRITSVDFPVIDLLQRADAELPTLAGIKYSEFTLDDLLRCVRHRDGHYNILFGSDEMLLAGLSMGAAGAVGSTYNFLGPYYQRVIAALAEGNVEQARQHQAVATEIVHAIIRFGGGNAIKAAMGLVGVDCGPPRLPLTPLGDQKVEGLRSALGELGVNLRS